MLRANCTSPPSDPPANLTWLINGYEVENGHVGFIEPFFLEKLSNKIYFKVKGLDIPPHENYPARQPISDASLENANRIIFSPWDTLPGYEETATEIIDIPDMDGVLNANYKKKSESTTKLVPRLELFPTRNISMEEEKSNKSSSFSQLVMRVQTSHFYKV